MVWKGGLNIWKYELILLWVKLDEVWFCMKGLFLVVYLYGVERYWVSKFLFKEYDIVFLIIYWIWIVLFGLDFISLNIYSIVKFLFYNYLYNWKIYILFVFLVILNVIESCVLVIFWIVMSGIICYKMIYSKLYKKYEIILSKMLL